MTCCRTDKHEAWAMANLMKARYGSEAISYARMEAERNARDNDAKPIWTAVIDALMEKTSRTAD